MRRAVAIVAAAQRGEAGGTAAGDRAPDRPTPGDTANTNTDRDDLERESGALTARVER